MRIVRRPTKRIAIIGIIIAVLFSGVGLYAWQSVTAWQGFERRLVSERAEYDKLRTEALSGSTVDSRLKALRALDDKVSTSGTLCHMNSLYAWQGEVVPVIKGGMSACKAAVAQLSVVSAPLAELRDYLDTAEKLREVVVSLVPNGNLNESNWAQMGLNRAKEVQKTISELSARGDAAELKKQAVTKATTLVASWESLLKANEAKDKTAFLTSAGNVTKAYADFAGLADTTDETIKRKVAAVSSAYQQ